jgi:hypothetical protein
MRLIVSRVVLGIDAAWTAPAPSGVALIHAASKPVAAAVEAWRPPPGPRQDVVAIAYAFPTLDERSLGALFDANLRPLYGAPSLFVPHTPLRIVRHDLRTSLERLTDTTQLDLGFRHAMAGLGTSWNARDRVRAPPLPRRPPDRRSASPEHAAASAWRRR